MMPFFPLRKIRRNGTYLLFGAVLVVMGVAGYLEYVATNLWHHVGGSQQNDQTACGKHLNRDSFSNEDIVWSSKYVPQPWSPEYKGQANLHVFEDWCGTSITSLRKNPHYPLYPHSRITVKKLAVAPNWNSYGLRIFGYIHPSTSGEFLFAVASSDNCEFWLSQDENPENLRLRAYVGKTGEEWTAPGEYSKYTSQISKPVILQQQKRFYFELLHKHNNHGTDHVEVAWRLNKAGTLFELIDSNSLSLYTAESSLKMSDVSHIPQTAASHVAPPLEKGRAPHHRAEMLKEDPRDTFFKTPLLDRSRFQSLLPECSYRPSYTVKGKLVTRYQGLQFVHLSYVYPNDYTRLTHMENSNMCFYQIRPYYFEMYGFSHYLRLDQPEENDVVYRDGGDPRAGWNDFRVMERAGWDKEIRDKEEIDNIDEYNLHQQRKLLSNSLKKKSSRRRRRTNKQDMNRRELVQQENLARDNDLVPENKNRDKLQKRNKMADKNQQIGWKDEIPVQKEDKEPVGQVNSTKLEDKAPVQDQRSRAELHVINRLNNDTGNIFLSTSKHKNPHPREERFISQKRPHDIVHDKIHQDKSVNTDKGGDFVNRGGAMTHKNLTDAGAQLWVMYGDSETEAEVTSMSAYDPEIRWNRTFQVGQIDFQMLRDDWIDLNCNVSGNLLISQSEATAVVQAFMEELELKYPSQFSLQRIINVEKRMDPGRGNRYLLELDLMESSGHRVRLVHYIYVLKWRNVQQPSVNSELLLCNPRNFLWNPDATIHIILPVKNQARWVQKFITDMEELHRVTGDDNVNIIITDYSSTDMDIEQALKNSHLPRAQYVRLTGDFERSAGLQAGIDLVTVSFTHTHTHTHTLYTHQPLY
ncbi:N-acetyl-beta-glucosaminyl-glycoprotein 4-beta-N-acetylgalactosaminyltransferase 1 isoform X2 [Neoarius graeffei]|uniref:N-acetyl-beta-glucosaminyl-glycoprotein 4-beta-N-acetylgalactosaminyltransferase 1 isoform X2 n=1 Tax=Neoarius graeffei TaxID=443677 RepID=UPI00298BD03E|nr:N-acetyl-beta-glucosaminyl-glycoprotein 4-beta-N-acetylgalactosaminyltransferase 1 isoform X2 [Neoarius graeffei]